MGVGIAGPRGVVPARRRGGAWAQAPAALPKTLAPTGSSLVQNCRQPLALGQVSWDPEPHLRNWKQRRANWEVGRYLHVTRYVCLETKTAAVHSVLCEGSMTDGKGAFYR